MCPKDEVNIHMPRRDDEWINELEFEKDIPDPHVIIGGNE